MKAGLRWRVIFQAILNHLHIAKFQFFSFDIESGKLDSSFGQAHFNVLVLMDDVIFSGKTMFNAIQGLDLAGVDSIFVSVLIDRGHRSMPVLAEFVGKQIPTKLNEHVHVELLENNLHQVYITNQ